jgi:hypothetical protein
MSEKVSPSIACYRCQKMTRDQAEDICIDIGLYLRNQGFPTQLEIRPRDDGYGIVVPAEHLEVLMMLAQDGPCGA